MEVISMDVEGSSEMDNWSDNRSVACSDCQDKTHKDIDWLQKSLESRFCCGGEIELEDETITIGWGYSAQGEHYQIDFPLDTDLKKGKVTTLFKRLHTNAKEDGIIDAALGGSVTTSFDHNRAGLVDMISQLMVPGLFKARAT
jgi:hypothetical protein